MLVYYAFGKEEARENREDIIDDDDEENDIVLLPKIATYLQIQKMVKLIHCHRNIVDLDTGYVNSVVREDKT